MGRGREDKREGLSGGRACPTSEMSSEKEKDQTVVEREVKRKRS